MIIFINIGLLLVPMADKSLLLEYIGDTPFFRMVDFLIENKGMDFSKTEIAKGAKISRTSLFNFWKKVEWLGLVKVTRRFGKTKLYNLDSKNPIVKTFLRLELELIEKSLKRSPKKLKKKVLLAKM